MHANVCEFDAFCTAATQQQIKLTIFVSLSRSLDKKRLSCSFVKLREKTKIQNRLLSHEKCLDANFSLLIFTKLQISIEKESKKAKN